MQLKFDDNFSNINNESNIYYKTLDDIPIKIKDFIIDTIDNIYIYDYWKRKKYCSKCLSVLKNNYCSKCSHVYRRNPIYEEYGFLTDNIKNSNLYFYFFDFQDDDIILYCAECEVGWTNIGRDIKFNIIFIFKLDNYGLTNVLTNMFYLYKDYEEIYSLFSQDSYLYVDNLESLKEYSLYKYSFIWEMKDYLRNRFVDLSMLTIYPIYFKQFEYLVKLRLYALACDATPYFQSKIFKDNFGVDKSFLTYLQKINISQKELEILKLVPVKSKRILDLFASNVDYSKKIAQYTNLEKVYYYFKKENLNKYNLFDYHNYLEMCQKLKLDLHDKDVLFPEYFLTTYESISNQVALIEDKENNIIMKNLYNIYKINNFEDDTYKIFPASSIEDLIDESSQMNNCVRTYVSKIVSCYSQIYFLRKKSDLKKSLVTVEVKNGRVVQALAKNNTAPSDIITQFLDKWETKIIPITADDSK